MSQSPIEMLRNRKKQFNNRFNSTPKESSDSNFYPRKKEGTHHLRILPSNEEGYLPFVEVHTHFAFFGDRSYKVLCPEQTPTLGNPCPICEVYKKSFYKKKLVDGVLVEKTVEEYELDKKIGRTFRPSVSIYANVVKVIRENGVDKCDLSKVYVLQLTESVYDDILSNYENPMWGDITDWENGNTIDYHVTDTGRFFGDTKNKIHDYAVSPAPTKTAVGTKEEIEELKKKMPKLSKFLGTPKSYEVLSDISSKVEAIIRGENVKK
jgi:hypothetical protein